MNKQQEIAKYLSTVEQATIHEICKNVPFGYYHNEQKYIGEILARMVKDKTVIRVQKGIYKLNKTTSETQQPTLF